MDGITLSFLFIFFALGLLAGHGVLRSSGASYRGGGAAGRIFVMFLAVVCGVMFFAEKKAYDQTSHEMYGGWFHLLAAPAFGAMGVGMMVAVLASFGTPPTDG